MKRFCVLRLSALGDATHALAFIQALQALEPDAEVTWIIGKLERRLMEGLPNVELITFDKGAGLKGVFDLRRQLRGRRFDVLFHMQVAARANLLSGLIRAPLRIGFDRARSRDGHGLFVNRRIAPAPGKHVIDGLLSFLPEAGLKVPERPTWRLPLAPGDLAFAQQHVDPARRTLTISAVSSHALRNWLPERYAQVADYAAGEHQMQVILAGAPTEFERQFNADIAARMSEPVLDLTGRDTLKELAGLLGASDAVLAPDTGPMHIANALGTPVIGLHAASNPRRSGPYDSLRWCVDAYDEAARKYRGKPAAELRWGAKIEEEGVMELVTVEAVKQRLDALLAKKGSDNIS
ncbi:MAG: glycosyltransferase family 9 protein [Pseudomonadota bacterium]